MIVTSQWTATAQTWVSTPPSAAISAEARSASADCFFKIGEIRKVLCA
jgi:hypothetical protein